MKVLDNYEMMDVRGGAVSVKLVGLITGIIAGIIAFAIGSWDGYINPNPCRK